MAGLQTKTQTQKTQKPKPKEEIPLSVRLLPYAPFLFLCAGVFSFFALVSFEEGEYASTRNLFGRLGHYYSFLSFYLFGRASYLVPFLSLVYGLISFQKRDVNISKLVGFLIPLLASFAVICSTFETEIRTLRDGGGAIGVILSSIFEFLVGKPGKILISIGGFIYGLLLVVRESPKQLDKNYWKEYFQSRRNKIFNFIAPEADQELVEHTKETSIERDDSPPWFEIKKPGEVKKAPAIFDFSDKPFNPFSMLRKNEEKKAETQTETVLTEEFEKEKEEFTFPKTSSSLQSKIYKTAIDPNPDISSEAELLTTEEWKEETVGTEKVEISLPAEEIEELISLDGIVSEVTKEDEIDDLLEPEKEVEEDYLGKEEKQPRLTYESTVPQVKFTKKGDYEISKKIFSYTASKKPDPMFKMEAEYIARRIEEIIKEYGYDSKVVIWEKGPIITRYELSPPPGVKLGRITSLSDELKLYLAVKSIRIVAPIPGKSTIGIEVPNKYRESVFLGDLLQQKDKEGTIKDLEIIIGKDSISGKIISIELNKLPHLLIAGTTGSGKSVSMNSMISSLIFSKSPEEVRFVMIDPKMVEMAIYENIPHLLMPVITDPRKANRALNWAVQEMETRYAIISDKKCRDLRAYNEKIKSGIIREKTMPYIVIFIDELSDLMMVAGKELEDYITRISQKSRAVGIHLVMATQRPSVDVITGLIKANCPARIAFQVAQKTDSKIILDYSGADALLGQGDFLYKSPTSPDLQRIQAPFISDDEIQKIVNEAVSFARAEFVSINLEEESSGKEEPDDNDEELFDEAWNIVRTERKASASYLQRRLRIGYNKAARLMELMEERGYVGPQIGSKPREILR